MRRDPREWFRAPFDGGPLGDDRIPILLDLVQEVRDRLAVIEVGGQNLSGYDPGGLGSADRELLVAAVPIVGAAAAARVLGRSARTVRRWLARCPPPNWPDASTPGRAPAWSSTDAVREWWAGRMRWSSAEPTDAPSTPRQRRRAPRSTATAPAARNRLLARLRGDG